MAGTIVGAINRIYTPQGRPQIVEIVLTCTADSAAHDYPATVINTLAGIVDFDLRGLKLYAISQVPGTTPPTNASDLTITDKYGIDLLGGHGTDFISHATASRYVLDPALGFIITGDLTVTITNNSVNSAVITLSLEFVGY